MNLKIQGLVLLLSLGSLIEAGRTITDGFESKIVRPSIIRPKPDPNPCFRFFDVYVPDEFDTHPEMTFPVVYHLTGLGGTYNTYSTTDRIVMDQMLANNEVVPMIIVAPDPKELNYDSSFWTDSNLVQDPAESFNNMFERYIIEELIPYIDRKYRQKKTEDGDAGPFRAIMGQSMGGYGSLFYGIKHPELFCGYAGDSATAFWVINDNLASPPEPGFPAGNPAYSFNRLLMPGLVLSTPQGRLQPGTEPDNEVDESTFGFFAWSSAFSPIVEGIGPENCTDERNACLFASPFCVDYPFNVGTNNVPQINEMPPITTVTGASFTLPAQTISVESTAGFPLPITPTLPKGALLITSSEGRQVVAYSSIVGNSFRGCTGGTGTVSAGALVTLGTFVENPAISQQWKKYDPYALLDTVDPAILRRKAIYLDAGADPVTELIDNVGAHYFSEKLNSFDVTNEYLLFSGGHTTCTSSEPAPPPSCDTGLPCYRFTTNLKLFSGKFSEAGVEPTRVIITGTQTIELTGNSVMSIADKSLLAIETDHDAAITQTNVTLSIRDSARLEIGNNTIIGGGLQVGNRYSKANLLFDPTRVEDSINFNLIVDGPAATLQIGKQGYLGFGIGVFGNNTDVSNYWGLSSLSNVSSVTLALTQGRFEHNQIASSLNERGSLFALGMSDAYTFSLSPESFVIAGGGNIALITEANLIHPTVQDAAGVVNPGGIRNCIVTDPATTFDLFYGPPKGLYASHTFSENLMTVGILSSSLMLFDTLKTPVQNPTTQDQLFNYLAVASYFDQGRKRAPIVELDGQLVVGYIVPETVVMDGIATTIMAIKRVLVDQGNVCNPLSVPFPSDKVLEAGAVGIALATINGQQQIIRLYDLDPTV